MEDVKELKTYIKLWFIAIVCICYSYLIPARISPGVLRLLTLLPIITIFTILPLSISTVHLLIPTFFFLVWLANFKLLLFAFNHGPLSSKPPLPILTFITIALLPINPKQSNNKRTSNPLPSSLPKPILLALKAAIFTIMIHVYQYKDNLKWYVMLVLLQAHIYLCLELILSFTAFLAKIILGSGFEIEPHFNEPYLATSLQDFWANRWNLMSTTILRSSVYNPLRVKWKPTAGVWVKRLITFVTFVVSGLMHELMYLYLTRVQPTWEVTWFFVVHGVCTVVEVEVKKAVKGRFTLHRVVSRLVTVSFVLVTGCWLLVPQIVMNGGDDKIINEASNLLKVLQVI